VGATLQNIQQNSNRRICSNDTKELLKAVWLACLMQTTWMGFMSRVHAKYQERVQFETLSKNILTF
jgi:hypothetical protein